MMYLVALILMAMDGRTGVISTLITQQFGVMVMMMVLMIN